MTNSARNLNHLKKKFLTRGGLPVWRGGSEVVKAWTLGARRPAFELWLPAYWLCDFEQVTKLLILNLLIYQLEIIIVIKEL